MLELQPASGTALRVPSARIASVAEPEPFTVLVTLADGTALELSRLGRMRTQLLEDLRDARAEVAAAESGAVGGAARFTDGGDGSPVDLHVFEDALLVMDGGSPRRVAFSFVTDVQARDYTVTIDVAGQARLAITRLGRRTDEFTALLAERLREASSRTSAFLGSLLPGLDPMALRAAAGLLRDGVAVPARALDAVHPDLTATLLRVATLPDRFAARGRPRRPGRPGDRLQAGGLGAPRRRRRHPVAATRPRRRTSASTRRQAGGSVPGLGGMIAAGMMADMGPGGGLGGYGPAGYGRRVTGWRVRRRLRLRRAVRWRARLRRLRRLLGVPRARRGAERQPAAASTR